MRTPSEARSCHIRFIQLRTLAAGEPAKFDAIAVRQEATVKTRYAVEKLTPPTRISEDVGGRFIPHRLRPEAKRVR